MLRVIKKIWNLLKESVSKTVESQYLLHKQFQTGNWNLGKNTNKRLCSTMVVQLICNQQVDGSNPSKGTIFLYSLGQVRVHTSISRVRFTVQEPHRSSVTVTLLPPKQYNQGSNPWAGAKQGCRSIVGQQTLTLSILVQFQVSPPKWVYSFNGKTVGC